MKNTEKDQLNGFIAVIRNCVGFVIKLEDEDDQDTFLEKINSLKENKKINVYALQNSHYDGSYPNTIFEKDVDIINRYGWFISFDNMKFPKPKNGFSVSYVTLRNDTVKYYSIAIINESVINYGYFLNHNPSDNLSVDDYLYNYRAIKRSITSNKMKEG